MPQVNAQTSCYDEILTMTPDLGLEAADEADRKGGEITGRQDSAGTEPRKGVRCLACFFALIVLLAFGTNAVIGAGVRRIKTSSYGAWNQAMRGQVNADIIISGSSRAAYHYDPRTIEAATGDSAFNLGRVGSQTDVQVAVLKTYLEHNRKPIVVIHNLDAFSFVTTREIFDPAIYVPYLQDKVLYNSLRQLDPQIIKSRYVPLYGYVVEDMNLTWFVGVKALFGVYPKEDYFLGFSPRDREWTDDFEKYEESNPNGVTFAIQPAGVQALDELIQICRKNGVKLVLVYSPEYSEMQAMTKNRAEIFAQFQELADRNQVPLWDYSKWRLEGDRNFFYNSQHLNARGAAIFSSDFAERLKNYLGGNSKAAGQIQSAAKNPDFNERRN